jgi:hypothetical protein
VVRLEGGDGHHLAALGVQHVEPPRAVDRRPGPPHVRRGGRLAVRARRHVPPSADVELGCGIEQLRQVGHERLAPGEPERVGRHRDAGVVADQLDRGQERELDRLLLDRGGLGRRRHARRNVSWTRSSASSNEPSMR